MPQVGVQWDKLWDTLRYILVTLMKPKLKTNIINALSFIPPVLGFGVIALISLNLIETNYGS